MHFTLSAALTALAAAVLAVPTVATAAADPVRAPGSIDIPCAAATLHQNADWYLPDGTPRALIWLQHGFARDGGKVADLARTLSNAGYLVFAPSLPFFDPSGCTLQNLGHNTAFLDHVAELFATAGDPGGGLAASLAAAAADTGRPVPALPPAAVFIGHSAGAEAVEYVAHRLHASHPDAWANLRGLILLDPVKSFLGNNTDTALTDLDPTGLPILTVSGPPGLCNNFGSGTTALATLLHRRFLGVHLRSGEHTDAEGPSSDALGELACGVPRSANVSALQSLTTRWTDDFLTDSSDYRDIADLCAQGSFERVCDPIEGFGAVLGAAEH
ncbi:alpha/beta hydrolase [Nocardia sp. NPDC004722]